MMYRICRNNVTDVRCDWKALFWKRSYDDGKTKQNNVLIVKKEYLISPNQKLPLFFFRICDCVAYILGPVIKPLIYELIRILPRLQS